ncbi:hypothetical protein OUZ56_018756 [Daphnia magna]|uniref:Uncharacterized protein n=1 Tax=Daphnia magna TaxID=35525 RepID=A0ABQ9Z9P2_9CRUS|nr:hypothetical protein OUZ56_018756 [Daphnia magna]
MDMSMSVQDSQLLERVIDILQATGFISLVPTMVVPTSTVSSHSVTQQNIETKKFLGPHSVQEVPDRVRPSRRFATISISEIVCSSGKTDSVYMSHEACGDHPRLHPAFPLLSKSAKNDIS